MGLTERHLFENEDVPENYEWALEDAVYNSIINKKHEDGIVLCKDCKYWKNKYMEYDVHPWLPCMEINTKWNWFCANGERNS